MLSFSLGAVTLLAALQVASLPDTVVLDAAEAFRRAVATAPSIEAARQRMAAAEARVDQARRWSNPTLSVTAENLGATRRISGVEGFGGVEGQAVLGGWLPLGGDRGATRTLAEAYALETAARSHGAEADARLLLIETLARAERDRARLARARQEVAGLESLSAALQRQATLGRSSDGEAARAHLASVSARALAAEIAVEAAASTALLATLVGLPAETVVVVEAMTCASRGPSGPPAEPPEMAAAKARATSARALVAESRARRVPDLLPQIGIRRVGGVSALFAGFSIALPLLDGGGPSVTAARHEQAAAEAELASVERSLASEVEGARRGLAALEEAGRLYDATWEAALDRVVEAAEARYRLGEGTLTELLDGRRARLQALDDYERWRASTLVQRARLTRLTGGSIDAALLCTSPSAPHTLGTENTP